MTPSVCCSSSMLHGKEPLALLRNSLLSISLALALTCARASADERSTALPDAAVATVAPTAVRVDAAVPSPETASVSAPAAENSQAATLSPRMQTALDYVRTRYKVSREAVLPLFEAVQWIARERGLDPLLIVALIGIESGFNVRARSATGGHGLMQIIPRYHLDKIPGGLGAKGLMDPVVNVKVGAHVLDEAIRRAGSTMAGLQSYNGSDRKGLFARRVLAERSRLEQGAP